MAESLKTEPLDVRRDSPRPVPQGCPEGGGGAGPVVEHRALGV